MDAARRGARADLLELGLTLGLLRFDAVHDERHALSVRARAGREGGAGQGDAKAARSEGARADTLTWSLSPVFLGRDRHSFAAALRAPLSGRRAGMPLMESNMADVGFPRVRRRWSAPAPTRTAAVNFNPRGTVASMHEGRAVGRRRLRVRCRAGTSAGRSGGDVRPETRFSRFRARAVVDSSLVVLGAHRRYYDTSVVAPDRHKGKRARSPVEQRARRDARVARCVTGARSARLPARRRREPGTRSRVPRRVRLFVLNRVGALDTIGAMHRRVASRRPWLRFAAFLVCVAGCVAPAEVAAQTVSYARFSSGFPTATQHHDGTNTLTLAAALDRAGAAYYVVVRQPNGMTGGSVIEPTPAEIFAGTSSGGAVDDVFASGSSPSRPPTSIARSSSTPSPTSPSTTSTSPRTPATPPSRTTASPHPPPTPPHSSTPPPSRTSAPPSFARGSPRAGAGPTPPRRRARPDEPATAHVLVLPADATPPADASAVVAGTSPDGADAVAFHGSVSPPSSAPATTFNVTGDLFRGRGTRCTWRSRTRRRFPTSRPRWRR